ncbi:hypothetical protein [Yinghuangia seranimata]|uniref:hypothetical protein n=1 Tax=Yinghuangia seranimata TaxID=408067 RepID=UPI00248B0CCA|nr:hypothetical protein [Yinghuangia seranimata]MDI2125766.1 hypothetical protein [Yinghuangia seranimata]
MTTDERAAAAVVTAPPAAACAAAAPAVDTTPDPTTRPAAVPTTDETTEPMTEPMTGPATGSITDATANAEAAPGASQSDRTHEAAVRTRPDACPGTIDAAPADDGLIARVRLPGGRLSAAGLRVLAACAAELGTGELDLTVRGNAQLRGLDETGVRALAGRLATAGLYPSATHDRARNIVASPFAGVGRDPRAYVDAEAIVTALDQGLCDDPQLGVLPGRFLFAVDDGGLPVATARHDVALVAVGPDELALAVGGVDTGIRVPEHEAAHAALQAARAFLRLRGSAGEAHGAWHVRELPGGGESLADALRGGDETVAGRSAQTHRHGHRHTDTHTTATSNDAESAAQGRATADRAAAGTRQGLAAQSTPPSLTPGAAEPAAQAQTIANAAAAQAHLGPASESMPAGPTSAAAETAARGHAFASLASADSYPGPASESTPPGPASNPAPAVLFRPRVEPPVGVVRQRDGLASVSVLVPLGRLGQAQLVLLADLCDLHGARLRVTTWRGVVLVDVSAGVADQVAAALEAAGLPADPASPWRAVSACSGVGECRRARADVRGMARAFVASGEADPVRAVHFAACERGCGKPPGAALRVVDEPPPP